MNCFAAWFRSLPENIQTPLVTAFGTIFAALLTVSLGAIIFYTDKASKQKASDINLRKNEYLKIIESIYSIIGSIPRIATQSVSPEGPDMAKEINDHLAVIMLITLVGSKETIEKTLKFHKDAYKCAMQTTHKYLEIKLEFADLPKEYLVATAANVLNKVRRDENFLALYTESIDALAPFKESISEIIISMRNDLSNQSFTFFGQSRDDRDLTNLINETINYQVELERDFSDHFNKKVAFVEPATK